MMTPDRWQEIQGLFQQAADLDSAAQAAFLTEACPTDLELRGEVEALLRAEQRFGGGAFLAEAIGQAARDLARDAAASRVGERVGPYRLVRELGHGGMGTVYLAERADEQYHASVAIKFVRSGAASAELARRFRAERQILAALTHPNIAWLLDGGTAPDGTPYLVMEYVEGEPIDAWCDRRGLGLEGRLALFLRVCSAVQHAHQTLVVHRDLKPSNILVTGDGMPKLVDFGIAKLLAESDAEATGTLRLLTPAYGSPEQARGGHITVATDVYSLGVVLFKLVSGRTPLDLSGATPGEIERRICEQAPPAPSAAASGPHAVWRRKLHGDVDTIVLKALRKEPERRYASVEQLALDLRRHMDGRPVSARPDTWRYRTGKFGSRHRASLAAAAGVLVLVGGLTAFYTARVASERDRAQVEAARGDRVVDFLKTVFLESNPDESQGRVLTAPQLLDRGVARLATLVDEPETQADLMQVIGDVYRGLGRYDDADRQLTGALAIRAQVRAPEDADLADLLNTMGVVKRLAGDYMAADTFHARAAELRQRLFGTESTEFADALNDWGEARRLLGKPESAESASRQALAIRRRLLPTGHRDVADNLNNLALLLHGRGDYAGAEQMHREALAYRRRLGDGDHFEISNSLNNLALTLVAQGKFTEAEPLYVEALAQRRQLFGMDAPRTLNTQKNYGALLHAARRDAAAQAVLEDALRRMGRHLGPDHPYAVDGLVHLALVLGARGSHDSARATAARAHAAANRRLGPQHRSTLEALRTMGVVAAAGGDRVAAESLLTIAHDGLRDLLGTDHPATAQTRRELIALYEAWGRPEDAGRYRAGGMTPDR